VIFLVFLSFCLSSPAFALRPLTTDEAYTVDRKVLRPASGRIGGVPACRQALNLAWYRAGRKGHNIKRYYIAGKPRPMAGALHKGTFHLQAGLALETLIVFPAQSIGTDLCAYDNLGFSSISMWNYLPSKKA